jgi:hypothetical protein
MRTLILILISLYTSSKLIAEQWSKDKVLSDFRTELNQIQNTAAFNKLILPDFAYEDPNVNITFTNLQPQLFVLNTERLVANITDSNSFLFINNNPGDFMLKYTFNYTINNITESGNVTLTNTNFTFIKSYYANVNGTMNVAGDMVFDVLVNDIEIPDQSRLQNVTTGFNGYTKSITQYLIKQQFKAGINNYYSMLNKQKPIYFDFYSSDLVFETLDLSFANVPTVYNNTVVFYRKGSLDDYVDDEDITFPTSDSGQYYVSKLLFNKFISEHVIGYDFTIRRDNLPVYSHVDLNIQYLGRFIPSLYNNFPRSARFKVNNNITNFYPAIIATNSYVGTLEVYTNFILIDEQYLGTKVFEFVTYLNFNIKDELNNKQLNFLIDEVEVILIRYYDNKLILSVDMMKDLLTNLYKNFFANNKKAFFRDNIDISSLFGQFDNIEGLFSQNGYILKSTQQEVVQKKSMLFLE